MSTLLLIALLAVFPTVEGETLTGKKVRLPEDLNGRTVLIVAGFTKDSQKQTEPWAKRIAAEFPELETWSIADLEEAPRFIRPLIVKGMKSATPAAKHNRYVVLTKGGKALAEALSCPLTGAGKDDACMALRVAEDVAWHFHGPPTDSALASLRAALHR